MKPALGILLVVTALIARTSCAAPTQQAYLKALHPQSFSHFGYSVAASGDTLVVGAPSDAAYVFVRRDDAWWPQARLRGFNTGVYDYFGWAVAVSGDTIVIGAPWDASNATGINGDQTNRYAPYAGAAYIFVRDGTNWNLQAYLKASNTAASDGFGAAVAIFGETVVIGAGGEDSGAPGVNQSDNSALDSGAAYVFVREGTNWSQQAYLKASNPGGGDVTLGLAGDLFGLAVAISGDTVVVGSRYEASKATGVDGDQNDNSSFRSGAAYVFARSGSTWIQQAYLKASNSGVEEYFGHSVSISGDTVVVGAHYENSKATGVNGNQADKSAPAAGAAYVFVRDGSSWIQQAYLKASNAEEDDLFGSSVAVAGDTIVVGAVNEASNARGVNGDESDNSARYAGAGYVFVRRGTNWNQQAYLKASNTEARDAFGSSVAVTGDTVLVGASWEASNAMGVNGDQTNNSATESGSAYVFTGFCPSCPRLVLARDGGNGFVIRFNGEPDVPYRLERASHWSGPWDHLTTLIAPESGLVLFGDTLPLAGQAFYRIAPP